MSPCAIIDPRLPEDAVNALTEEGFIIIPVALTDRVDTPLSGHPDIQMFYHEKKLFVHPDIHPQFLISAEKFTDIVQCSTKLGIAYPDDIPYNIACTGDTALHKKKSTDKTILEYFAKRGITVIDTKQGYSKCSTMIVDDNSIITADRSIYSAALNAGMDSLLISHGHIDLPGYDYGFIGGIGQIWRYSIPYRFNRPSPGQVQD